MEHHVRLNLFSTAAVLALGAAVSLITSTVVASRAYRARVSQIESSEQEITVKGSARMRVTSDLAVWRITMRGDGESLQTAFTVLQDAQTRVQAFLDDAGFSADERAMLAIETDTHFVRDENGRETREIDGYTLTRQLTITSADVQRVADAAGRVTELLRDNIQVQSQSPEFTYSKVSESKVEILEAASTDAKRRAEAIAIESGCTLGEVRQARMGVMQITQPHSTRVTSYGIYDTSTIEKDISVVVTVTYGVARTSS